MVPASLRRESAEACEVPFSAAIALGVYFAAFGVIVNVLRLLTATAVARTLPTSLLLTNFGLYAGWGMLLVAALSSRRIRRALVSSRIWFHGIAVVAMLAAVAATVTFSWWAARSWHPLGEVVAEWTAFALPITVAAYLIIVVVANVWPVAIARDQLESRLGEIVARSSIELERRRRIHFLQSEVSNALGRIADRCETGDDDDRYVIETAEFLRALTRQMDASHAVAGDEVELLRKWLRVRVKSARVALRVDPAASGAQVASLSLLREAAAALAGAEGSQSIVIRIRRRSDHLAIQWDLDRETVHSTIALAASDVPATVRPVTLDRRSGRLARKLVRMPRAHAMLALMASGAFAATTRALFFEEEVLWRWDVFLWGLWVLAAPLLFAAAARLVRSSGRWKRDFLLLASATFTGALLASLCTGAIVNLPWFDGSPGDYLADVVRCAALSDTETPVFIALSSCLVIYGILSRRTAAFSAVSSYRTEQRIRRSQVDVLQYQLQSHFLYNSLGTIAALRDDDPAAAADVARRLVAYHRRCAALTQQRRILLTEELALVDAYLRSQSVEAEFPAALQWKVEGDLADCTTAPMILQPLVENALRYAVRRDGSRAITVSVRHWNQRIEVQVVNAIAPGYRLRREGTGLTNLRQRLQLAYGDDAALDVIAFRDWVTVRLSIPAQ